MEQIQQLNVQKNDSPQFFILSQYLEKFISGLTQNEKEQQEILNHCVRDLKNAGVHDAGLQNSCNDCYGRGFTGYDRVHQNIIVCNQCFPHGNFINQTR